MKGFKICIFSLFAMLMTHYALAVEPHLKKDNTWIQRLSLVPLMKKILLIPAIL